MSAFDACARAHDFATLSASRISRISAGARPGGETIHCRPSGCYTGTRILITVLASHCRFESEFPLSLLFAWFLSLLMSVCNVVCIHSH